MVVIFILDYLGGGKVSKINKRAKYTHHWNKNQLSRTMLKTDQMLIPDRLARKKCTMVHPCA